MRSIVLAALAVLSAGSGALAGSTDYNRIIAFGDSLSDNGNYDSNATSHLSPPYYGAGAVDHFGRFSNGPTWMEMLSDPHKTTNPDSSMNRFWAGTGFTTPFDVGGTGDNVNAAIGGATTTGGTVPAVDEQITQFLGAGGVFGANDLVSVQGGANDFTSLLGAPVLDSVAISTGIATANNEATNIDSLIAAGAKNILVSDLPDLAVLPSVSGSPATAHTASVVADAYNSALHDATVALAAAHPDVNLIQMDWSAMVNVLRSRPDAFGFTNVTDACYTGAVCATPDTYLFWDSSHTTNAAQRYVAQYANLLLSTDETGSDAALLGQSAFDRQLHSSDILFRAASSGFTKAPLIAYAKATGGFENGGARGGALAGFDASLGPVSLGADAGFDTGSLSGPALTAAVTGGHLAAYAFGDYGQFFGGVEAGVSFDSFGNIRRDTGFPTVVATGSTSGLGGSVAATLGMRQQAGTITIVPAVRLGFAAVRTGGYTETAPLLALQYSDRLTTTLFYQVRVRASAPLPMALPVDAFGEIGYEGLGLTSDSYTAKLAGNTAKASTISPGLAPDGFYFRGGLETAIGGAAKIEAEYDFAQHGGSPVNGVSVRVAMPL